MQVQGQWLKIGLVAFALLFAGVAQAQSDLNESGLDRWLETTKAFMPMQDVFRQMGESETAQAYSSKDVAEMDQADQDELMDKILKENDAYDKVYAVLEEHDWSSAGQYMRASERYGKAITAYMREKMLKSLPPEQAKMVEDRMGTQDLNVPDEDVAFIKAHWDRISQLMGQQQGQGAMPMAQ